ncbi:phosphoribosylanthranilate isomerase [Mucilaginibacter sp. Bleaf8]|uniref:phosphoribosylanthranilate isomerase n=1 Tax=Mucilaginibacter sp. Bleaf8 TaxID=2834430 RepID=UPI001BCCF230|nr:phosphoribosylanthranilate isomerase [Mucilaginibacter sp. Bleaf8]MBS7562878.1 phosphoribosylanthranilate isomerase [Mucilaginibacter sp. Bleaf8]
MKIKVCGMKVPENIRDVAGLGPDLMGFICYSKSPRYMADLNFDTLHELPSKLIKTGVFVNEEPEKIKALIAKYKFNAVQLHGNETPETCKELKTEVTVLKAFGVDDSFDFSQLKAYADSVDYFMFDTKTDAHGGSGKTFNWGILNSYQLNVPFFICGGLSADNVAEVKCIEHPAFYGVDLNSRFETEPGFKDVEKLKQAFDILRN